MRKEPLKGVTVQDFGFRAWIVGIAGEGGQVALERIHLLRIKGLAFRV